MLASAKKMIKHAAIRSLIWRENRERSSEDRFNGLAPEKWGCIVGDDGCLAIDGVSVRTLSQSYGTPQHVLNEAELLRTYRQFLGAFSAHYPNVYLATSYKTNPVPQALKTLHSAGTLAEVISHFELWLALELGVSPENIILNGPGKGNDTLALAVEKGVQIINIDGPAEIAKIADLASRRGIKQRVGLRIITSVGWSSQFGLSIASGAAENAFIEMKSRAELIPCGLHLHLGTGIQSVDTYTQAVQELLEFSERLRDRHGIEIEYFDLGGGFGVPTVRSITEWDERMLALGYPARQANPDTVPAADDYAKALRPFFDRLKNRQSTDRPLPTVILEPGRAITSSSQILLLSVIGKKPGVDDKDYLILDGGRNLTMPLAYETHQVFAATKMNADPVRTCDLFGPLCHPGDVIMKNGEFPALEEGDVIAIMDAGAYFIPNQMNFSNPRPPVIAVRDMKHEAVRRREQFEDIVQLDELG